MILIVTPSNWYYPDMHDLTKRQRQVLELYRKLPNATYGEIAKEIGVNSKNSVAKLVHYLVDKGYVVLTPSRQFVHLTHKALIPQAVHES